MMAFKYTSEIFIDKIKLGISFPCKLNIIIKRGPNKIDNIEHQPLVKGIAKFAKSINIPATSYMYLDKDAKKFMEKKCTITIHIITEKATKVAGIVNLDLG